MIFQHKMAAILENKMVDTRYLESVAIFGFLGPKNIGIDTRIMFLSLLLTKI